MRAGVKSIYRAELMVLAFIVFSFLFYFAFSNVLNADEREHVYASFLVLKGYVPYRDFFEHHHGLLWYVFGPITALFLESGNIWYAVRAFSLVLTVADCFFIAGISFLIRRDYSFSVLSVLLFLAPECVMLSSSEFRPDVLMLSFILAGQYLFLLFLKERRQGQLNGSFVCFFLAIAALQKAVLWLFGTGCVIVYLLLKNKISFGNIWRAMAVPLAFTGIFIGILFYTGALKDYFELNWALNLKMRMHIRYPAHLSAYYQAACFLCAGVLLFSGNYFLRITAFWALVSCFIWQFIFYAVHRHYWMPLYPYFAIVTAYVLSLFKDKFFGVLLLTGIIGAVFFNCLAIKKEIEPYARLSSFVYLTSKILELSKKDDFIIGCTSTLGGLRMDATGYYWFGRDYVALLDYQLFHRREFPAGDNIVKARLPKIVSMEDWRNCMADDLSFTFDCKSVPTYDREFLGQYYYNQGFIYVRKY